MTNDDAQQSGPPEHRRGPVHVSVLALKRCIELFLITSSLVAIAAMTAGMFGRWHYLLDLASHLRVQATMGLLGAGIGLVLLRRHRVGGILLVIGGGLLISLLPFYWPTDPVTGTTYRLMTANVLTRNTNHAAVLRVIAETDPDLVVLQETDAEWTRALELGLRDSYPFRRLLPREDNFGMSVFSKHRWSKCDVVSFSLETQLPSVVMDLALPDGDPIQLIATHPLPPMRPSNWQDRNRTFDAIAEHVKQQGGQRTLVAGDLNCTPWSYWFRRLRKQSGLRNSSNGQGLHSTWNPSSLPLPGLMIDHVLVGAEIEVARHFVGPDIGSDHRPVIVDFH
ncbi:endonuclease/exonuclease/phosphatase family protein [Novipirellula caenicola]|uniref:Endonuclease/exonuclease/phosphatase domain-containing protein n=1 Tax=Novipirellula caenicola TaxID=1536901 RepID=A0ABP9VHJ2_9BACT